MSAAAPALASRRASPFSKRTVFLLVLASFLTFIAVLALIGAGETSRQSNDGGNHAAANGLNGFAGLVRLLELEGRNVTISRSPSAFETSDLLVLTPPAFVDAEEIEDILEKRFYNGPTLVILPKWFAQRLREDPTDDVEIEDGWVRLLWSRNPDWMEELPEPYALKVSQPSVEEYEATADAQEGAIAGVVPTGGDKLELDPIAWSGYGLSGMLPEGRYQAAELIETHEALVSGPDGEVLASYVMGAEDSDFYNEAYAVAFVIEPDLMNNYGLADETRAALALKIVEEMSYEWDTGITFDVTLNGLGGSQNLLTLAFRPPFLAATLCLILALMIIGWRGFLRFGPPLAERQAIAFGKRRLVANGAGLILRARRLRLLAEPYIALTTRRIGRRLGLNRPDLAAVSEALALRLPSEDTLIARAEAMREARGPKNILRAARALKELERKLKT